MVDQYNIRLKEAIYKKVKLKKLYLDSIKNSFVIKNPKLMYQNTIQKIETLNEKLNTIMINKIDINKNRLDLCKKHYILNNVKVLYKDKIELLNNIISKLTLLNPLNILERGYNITYKDNRVVSSVDDIKINDKLNVKMKDGTVLVNVESVEK